MRAILSITAACVFATLTMAPATATPVSTEAFCTEIGGTMDGDDCTITRGAREDLTFTAPEGLTRLLVDAQGGTGGSSSSYGVIITGGRGAHIVARVPIVAGETITISPSRANGNFECIGGGSPGAGGGVAFLTTSTGRTVAAGGGGGAGCSVLMGSNLSHDGGRGGDAGLITIAAEAGEVAWGQGTIAEGGGPASQSEVGAGGVGADDPYDGIAGYDQIGGVPQQADNMGGFGGCGFFGGGGGASGADVFSAGAGGGGGSSYLDDNSELVSEALVAGESSEASVTIRFRLESAVVDASAPTGTLATTGAGSTPAGLLGSGIALLLGSAALAQSLRRRSRA